MSDSGASAAENVAQQIGEMLRATRESRGESLSEAALALKLTQRQVEAMESGRFDLLPGTAFARGFLRNYARHLGVDPAAVMTAIEQPAAAGPAVELAPVSNAEGVMPAGGGDGRRTVVPIAALVAGLLLLVVVGWYFDWFDPARRPASTAETMPPAAEEQGAGAPLAEPQSPPAVPPAAGEPAAAPAEAVAPTAPTPAGTAEGAAATAAPEGAAGQPAAPQTEAAGGTPAASAAPLPSTAAGATAPGPAETSDRLQFRFDGDSWVEVRDAQGHVLYSGTNPAGSTRTVQGEPPFTLVVGNAGQVSLQYGGKSVDLAPHTRSNVARLTVK